MRAKSTKELEAQWTSAHWFSRSSNPTPPSEAPNLRLRRALSWLGRVAEEFARDDFDAAFIFYWIALNATYSSSGNSDSGNRREYLKKIVSVSQERPPGSVDPIFDTLWADLRDEIETLLNNRFVYQPQWNQDAEWEKDWENENEKTKRAIEKGRTERILLELFDRLYTLRNQLLHGCATWRGSKNREPVETGAKIMACLVPHFIEVMIDNPKAEWGMPSYPVLPD